MPTSTDEIELFHHTIENITEDGTGYNYWVPETSNVFPLLVSVGNEFEKIIIEQLGA